MTGRRGKFVRKRRFKKIIEKKKKKMRELQKKEEQPKRGLERTSGEDIKNKIGGGEGY